MRQLVANCNVTDTIPRAARCQPCRVQPAGRSVYNATCQFADGWWTIRVRGSVDVTARVRFLDEAEAQARHAIAVVTSMPEDSFDVVVEVVRAPANQ
jgi:hypothetical protein